MAWQYEYLSVKNNDQSVEIEVEFSESDDKGEVVDSIKRGYSFRRDSCPTRAELDRMVISDMTSIVDSKSRFADLSAAVGSAKKLWREAVFPTEPMDVSQTDKRIIAIKNEIKPLAIEAIHKDPKCSMEGLCKWVSSRSSHPSDVVSGMLAVLCHCYSVGAWEAGLTQEATFNAIRDFVSGKTIEELSMI